MLSGFLSFFLCVFLLGAWTLWRLPKPDTLSENARSLLAIVGNTVSHMSRKLLIAAALFLGAFMIIATLGVVISGDSHTVFVFISLILGLVSSIGVSKIIVTSIRKIFTLTVAELESQRSVQAIIIKGTWACGICVAGVVGAILTLILSGVSLLYSLEGFPILRRLDFFVPDYVWARYVTPFDLSYALSKDFMLVLMAVCFAATIYALCVRLSTSIFAKTSDIVSDTIQQEYDLLEDELRNPAVLADMAGDQLNGAVGNGLLLFESTLFLGMSSAVMTLIYQYSNGGLADNAARMSVILMRPVILFAIATALAILLHFIAKKVSFLATLPRQLVVIYLLLPVIGYICQRQGYLFEEATGIILTASVCGIFLVLVHQRIFGAKSYFSQSLCKESKINVISSFLKGFAYGNIMTIVLLMMIVIFAISACILTPASFSPSNIILHTFYVIVLASFIIISPSAVLLPMGISKSVSDNARGFAFMLMLNKDTQETAEALDHNASVSGVVMKIMVLFSGIASVISFPILLIYELNTQSGTVAELITFDQMGIILGGVITHPRFGLGVVSGGVVMLVILGVVLLALQKSISLATAVYRQQFIDNPTILTGEALPDYNQFDNSLLLHSRKWMLLLTLFFICITVLAMELLKVQGILGFMMGAFCVASLLSVLFLYSGIFWDFAKKRFDMNSVRYQDGSPALFLGVLDGIGDVMKDVMSPVLFIVLKVIGFLIILFSVLLL